MKSSRNNWFVGGVVIGLITVVLVIVLRSSSNQLEYSLNDENPAIRAAAIREMGSYGNEHLLIDRLNDENPDVRQLAAMRLGHRGSHSTESAVALAKALN